MKISGQSCQVINDGLALYYVESEKFGNNDRKRAIMQAIEEFNDMVEEAKRKE